jgi:glycosyltransferase involved in cell wall biosynthesis
LLHKPEAIPPTRRVLILAYWYPPENESGALRPFRFWKYLPKHGYDALVVAASSAAASPETGPVFRTPEARHASCVIKSIAWTTRLLERVLPYNDCLEWVPHAVATAGSLLRREEIPVIVSTSPPVATHMAALCLKRWYGARWIADFRDPLAGNPFRTRRIGIPYDILLERSIVSWADALVVNTDSAFEALALRYPKHCAKIHVIWNGYDPEDAFRAANIERGRNKTIAHFGSIYGGRHPGELLRSLQRLLQRGVLEGRQVKINLVGSIDRNQSWLRDPSFMELTRTGCLQFTDRAVPRDQARTLMGETDYLLLLDVNELKTALQVPGKLFEYVRIGRPILAFTTRGSPVDRILRQAGTPHVCVYPEDAAGEVDRKVLSLLSMPTEPVAPSAWFRRQFDAIEQASSLARIVAKLWKI